MTIGIDFDQIFAELKRIQRDMQQFPSATEVSVSEGGASKSTAEFRAAVAQVAHGMGVATRNATDALNDASEAIRQAVTEIAEQDAALADEARLILSLLDSAGEQAPSGGSADAGTDPAEADY